MVQCKTLNEEVSTHRKGERISHPRRIAKRISIGTLDGKPERSLARKRWLRGLATI